MKNIFNKSILLVIISLSSTNLFSQAFEKGNWNVDLGVDLGIYRTTSTYTTTLPFFGTRTLTETDGAASTLVPISVEYGLSNKFGIGVQLGIVNYFIDKKDSTDNTESVKSVDFSILVNYHMLVTEKNDLMLGLALGGSSVNWINEDDSQFKGTGSYVSLSLKDRLFFGEHVGMIFHLGYTVYNYTNIKNTSNNNFIEGFTWKLNGVNFGTGLALKF